jgi:hypothetical protein
MCNKSETLVRSKKRVWPTRRTILTLVAFRCQHHQGAATLSHKPQSYCLMRQLKLAQAKQWKPATYAEADTCLIDPRNRNRKMLERIWRVPLAFVLMFSDHPMHVCIFIILHDSHDFVSFGALSNHAPMSES